MKIEPTMPSYIINWEDLEDKFTIDEIVNIVGKLRDLSKSQRVMGFAREISYFGAPYLVFEWTAPHTIALMSISYTQSSYHSDDYWELWVDGDRLLETIYVKQLGDIKHWETVHWVEEGQVIRMIHHNLSHTSKVIWADLEVAGDKNDNA